MDQTPQQGRRKLDQILNMHGEFRSTIVPLCAAENPLSPYVRSFLSDPIHETYAMGGPRIPPPSNFAAAGYVHDLHRMVIDLCADAFGSTYADPRPNSGTSAVLACLMTLSAPGQQIMLQTIDSGGHASMQPICRRLGLEILDMPYDFDRLCPDYDTIRNLPLDEIDFVLYSPSDVLYPDEFKDVVLPESTTLVLDLTQTLGLIASGHHPSPFDGAHERTVVVGGTHKTLPGPSSGLLLTNHGSIADVLDSEVSPKYVRHSHPHHMAALCATMIEHQEIGRHYGDRMLAFSALLADSLQRSGQEIVLAESRPSETHQVLVHIDESRVELAFDSCVRAGITLNQRRKPLFRGAGLRFGVQEIARYEWSEREVDMCGRLISDALSQSAPLAELQQRVQCLSKFNTFDPMLLSSERTRTQST